VLFDKLLSGPVRESNHSIVLDLAQGKLGDAPLQRKASQLRLVRIRRKNFHLPAVEVLDQTAQV